jgi:hypothetical protein
MYLSKYEPTSREVDEPLVWEVEEALAYDEDRDETDVKVERGGNVVRVARIEFGG